VSNRFAVITVSLMHFRSYATISAILEAWSANYYSSPFKRRRVSRILLLDPMYSVLIIVCTQFCAFQWAAKFALHKMSMMSHRVRIIPYSSEHEVIFLQRSGLIFPYNASK
jgi:hypothetical protein